MLVTLIIRIFPKREKYGMPIVKCMTNKFRHHNYFNQITAKYTGNLCMVYNYLGIQAQFDNSNGKRQNSRGPEDSRSLFSDLITIVPFC